MNVERKLKQAFRPMGLHVNQAMLFAVLFEERQVERFAFFGGGKRELEQAFPLLLCVRLNLCETEHDQANAHSADKRDHGQTYAGSHANRQTEKNENDILDVFHRLSDSR